MNKIFQERVNNYELESNERTLFYPRYLELWNKGSIKTINGIFKKITGFDGKVKVNFDKEPYFILRTDKAYEGSLEYGDMDEMPKIKLEDGNVKTIYEVLSIDNENETFINIDSQVTKKDGKTLTQMFFKNIAYFIIKIDDVAYRITVHSPNDSDEIFELPYENELKDTLFNTMSTTSLPDIVSLLEYYLGKLDKYPKIEITRSIEERGKFSRTTDEFILKSGSLEKFMQTKKVGPRNYKVTVLDDKISYTIENLGFDEDVKTDSELVKQSMQYVKKYPKK